MLIEFQVLGYDVASSDTGFKVKDEMYIERCCSFISYCSRRSQYNALQWCVLPYFFILCL